MIDFASIDPPAEMLDALKCRYSEPQRAYHTWDHVEALLRHLTSVHDQLTEVRAVLFGLYWHDAVYDPMRSDNENASADLLESKAFELLAPSEMMLAGSIIRATQKHQLPENLSPSDQTDTALFLDIDLSILAADRDVFDVYESNIRKEYSFVPEDVYRQARMGILKSFLERDRLYFSDHFHDRWETAARNNLERSIMRLQ